MFLVTYVDYSDNSDWHGRFLGKYETREEAEEDIRADMARTSRYLGNSTIVRPETHEVWKSEGEIGENGCIWDIYEV